MRGEGPLVHWLSGNSLRNNNARLATGLITLLEQKQFQAPFLVLRLVTNRGLVSVPRSTNQYLEVPQQVHWGPTDCTVTFPSDCTDASRMDSRLCFNHLLVPPKGLAVPSYQANLIICSSSQLPGIQSLHQSSQIPICLCDSYVYCYLVDGIAVLHHNTA